jgi:hypothetical protein
MKFEATIKKGHIFMLSEILDKVEFRISGTNQEEIGMNMISSIMRGLWKAEDAVDRLICSVYGLIDVGNLTTEEYIDAITAIVKNEDFKKAWAKLTGDMN